MANPTGIPAHTGTTLLALLWLTIACYSPALDSDFVNLDDPMYVTENSVVLAGLNARNVQWAFETNATGNWHPLTWVSHLLDVSAFGLDPSAHHAVNIGLHLLNATLLFVVFRTCVPSRHVAFAVATIFALHPLQMESIAWVSQRKTLLCAALALMSICAYIRFARDGKMTWFAASHVFFGASLLAKSMSVTLPAILLLMDIWPLNRLNPGRFQDWRRRIREKALLFAMAAGIALVTFLVQRGGGNVQDSSVIPMSARGANAVLGYWAYLWQFVWPLQLAVHYPHPGIVNSWPVVLSAAAGLALITGLVSVYGRPQMLLGWLWFLVALLPMIGFIQAGGQSHADRYMYFPIIGLALIVAMFLARALEAPGRYHAFVRIPAAGCVAMMAFLTWNQAHVWRDSESLFRHAVSVSPESAISHNNLGTALFARGDYEAARFHFTRAAELSTRWHAPLANLALTHAALGNDSEAGRILQLLLTIAPNHPDAPGIQAAIGNAGKHVGHQPK